MRSQVVAIALIVAAGVASYVCVMTAWIGLKESRDAYYAAYDLADLFAPVRRAPRSVARELERIPGVRRVEARIVNEISIDLPDLAEPCTGRAISVPDRAGPGLNRLHLLSGGWFEGEGVRQAIVADRFAKTHGLEPGDSLVCVLNNRKESLRIVGTAISPEYVYMLRGAGDVIPDPVHFTVLWLSTTFAEATFDLKEACNEFLATKDPGADARDILRAFDLRLERYGAFLSYDRADQISNRYLTNEIDGLRGTAVFVPMVFLGVAAFVLHMLLSRLVQTQRMQIAVFRAFGFGTGALAWHYLKLVLLVGAAGAALGAGAGLWLGRSMLGLYTEFYSFPLLAFRADPFLVLRGAGFSLLFASLGAIDAVLRVARLQPAEGMRPEAPRAFRRTIVERLRFLWRRLHPAGRIIFRNVARHRLRTALTVLGVSMAGSLLCLSELMNDSIVELMDFQYRWMELQDIRVSFEEEREKAAIFDIRRIEGVRTAEAELAVPVNLRHGPREYRTAISGIPGGGRLQGLYDRGKRRVAPPEEGLLLAGKLADLIDAEPGDLVEAQLLKGTRKTIPIRVESVVDTYIGTGAWADLALLSRWIGEEEVASGALLLIDPSREAEVARALKSNPSVAAATLKRQSVENFRETLARSQGIMRGVIRILAGILAFGVIYNAARIALAERERELGSLRVLGFTRGEVSAILFGENLLLAALSIPPGLALGAGFGWILTRIYETDLFRIPFVFPPLSGLKAAGLVMLFAVLANLAIRRRVAQLDLVEILKTRE